MKHKVYCLREVVDYCKNGSITLWRRKSSHPKLCGTKDDDKWTRDTVGWLELDVSSDMAATKLQVFSEIEGHQKCCWSREREFSGSLDDNSRNQK